jgi:mannosyltransferase
VQEHSPRTAGGASASRRGGWALFALVALAFLLRFYRIGYQSLWVDEILTIQAAEVGGRMTAAAFFGNVQGPLHALLVHAVGWLSTSEAALRTVSAVASAATVPVLYVLACDLSGRRAGFIAAALGAVSPFSVWYAQEVRNYALLMLLAALATLCAERLASGKIRSWLGYVVSTVLALYCNLAAAFLAVAHGIYLAARARGDRVFTRRWLAASLVIALFFVPVAWGLVRWVETDEVGARVVVAPAAGEDELLRGETTFTPLALPYAFYALSYGYSLGPSTAELHTRPPAKAFLEDAWLVVPAGLAAALAALLGLRALAGDRSALRLVIAVVLVPCAGAAALALLNVKPFNARYISVALPMITVLCGSGIALLRRTPAVLLGGLMITFSVVALANYYSRPEYWREDVRGAARYVEANERPGDVVLVPVIKDVFEFYYGGAAERFVLYPGQAGSDGEVAARIEDGVRGHARLWYVEARLWRTDPESRIPAYLGSHYRLIEERSLAGTRLRLYELGAELG